MAASGNTSSFDLADPTFFGWRLTSFRNRDDFLFQHQAAIAAISILFFRTTVVQEQESHVLRYFFALLLAGLAYFQKSYELILAVELFSYAAARLLRSSRIRRIRKQQQKPPQDNHSQVNNNISESNHKESLLRLVYVALSGVASFAISHGFVSGLLLKWMNRMTPAVLIQLLNYLFPIAEVSKSYQIATSFAPRSVLDPQLLHLLFVTFHVQVGMGYLGIEFLRREQHRRNQLVRMDVMEESEQLNETEDNKTDTQKQRRDTLRLQKAKRYQKTAAPFIIFTALPYMAQIIVYGGMNKFAYLCVQHELHRTVRLDELFGHESHLIATATETPTSPEAYATAMDFVIGTSYEFFNRKFFSLPKILLLPGVMAKQPWLVAQVLPFIFISDFAKAYAVTFVTHRIEEIQKQINDLTAIRGKVEAFDMKNAELLQRSGAMDFTQRQWERLTVQIQDRQLMTDLLTRSKGFFAFMQRNFVFGVLIDCALASLLAVGRITSADTFVFSRAVEDTVDMILTRSRAEAELARMVTEQDKLAELSGIWTASRQRMLLPCHVPSPMTFEGRHSRLVLRNLHYSRGTASVRADHVELERGVYALTGPNGSGKSTLFRVLMSCSTNENPIDLPSSINMLSPAEPLMEEDDVLREVACEADSAGGPKVDDNIEDDPSVQECGVSETPGRKPVPRLSVTMPTTRVDEISQNFYWPLYTRPIEFFYQTEEFSKLSKQDIDERAMHVAAELHSLDFFQPLISNENSTETAEELEAASVLRIVNELKEEKEDWFSDLSGGQKSKAELVRKVFLERDCPGVLLVDETMAPLDPASKSIVMQKLKSFCSKSILIVIYHTDVAATTNSSSSSIECVPSSGFFDHNIHLEHGLLHLRRTC